MSKVERKTTPRESWSRAAFNAFPYVFIAALVALLIIMIAPSFGVYLL